MDTLDITMPCCNKECKLEKTLRVGDWGKAHDVLVACPFCEEPLVSRVRGTGSERTLTFTHVRGGVYSASEDAEVIENALLMLGQESAPVSIPAREA